MKCAPSVAPAVPLVTALGVLASVVAERLAVVADPGAHGGGRPRHARARRPRQRARHRDEPVGCVRLRRRPRLERHPDPRPLLRRHRVGHDRRDLDHGAADEPRRTADRRGPRQGSARRRRGARRSVAIRGGARGGGSQLRGVGPLRRVRVSRCGRSARRAVDAGLDRVRLGDGTAGHRHVGERGCRRPRRRVRAGGPGAVVPRCDPCGERHRGREPHRQRGAAGAVPAGDRRVGDVGFVGGSRIGGAAGPGRRGAQLRSRGEPLLVREDVRPDLPVLPRGCVAHQRHRRVHPHRAAVRRRRRRGDRRRGPSRGHHGGAHRAARCSRRRRAAGPRAARCRSRPSRTSATPPPATRTTRGAPPSPRRSSPRRGRPSASTRASRSRPDRGRATGVVAC